MRLQYNHSNTHCNRHNMTLPLLSSAVLGGPVVSLLASECEHCPLLSVSLSWEQFTVVSSAADILSC